MHLVVKREPVYENVVCPTELYLIIFQWFSSFWLRKKATNQGLMSDHNTAPVQVKIFRKFRKFPKIFPLEERRLLCYSRLVSTRRFVVVLGIWVWCCAVHSIRRSSTCDCIENWGALRRGRWHCDHLLRMGALSCASTSISLVDVLILWESFLGRSTASPTIALYIRSRPLPYLTQHSFQRHIHTFCRIHHPKMYQHLTTLSAQW